MKLVHISGKTIEEPKRLTKKQQYHEDMLEFIDRQAALDRLAAKEMFRAERIELNSLINQAIKAGYTQEEINELTLNHGKDTIII